MQTLTTALKWLASVSGIGAMLGTQHAVLCAIDLFGVYRYLIRRNTDA